ncbi:MAG: ATP-binding protein [Nitrospirae bacterium]|nr:ATP-binding protein [Nitrospirota bacterium]
MNSDFEKILQKTANLKRKFSQMSESLLQTSEGLSAPGSPPEEHLIDSLNALRTEFLSLTQEVCEQSASVGSPLPYPTSIHEIETAVTTLSAEVDFLREKKIEAVLNVLDRCLNLVHKGEADFGPLNALRSKATDLKRAILASDSSSIEVDKLEMDSKPFVALLEIIEETNTVSDEKWVELDEIVTRGFGRLLAVAASRGKLANNEAALYQVETAVETAIDYSCTEELKDPDIAATFSDLTDSLTEPQRVENATMKDGRSLKPVNDEDSLSSYALTPFSFAVNDDSAIIARGILQSGARQEDLLPTLICHLLLEGRYGMAFHLAKFLEALEIPQKSCIPSWLVRAIALAPLIRFDSGVISEILKTDFFRFGDHSSESAELNHAINFLLVGATLQPTLLAPNTGAAGILQMIRLRGLPVLSEFCKKVADYGNLQHPIDLNALRRIKDVGVWESEFAQLLKEVEAWKKLSKSMTFIYQPAGRVWKKWVEPKGLISSLIEPIINNEQEKVHALKGEIARLSNDNEFHREVEDTHRGLVGGRVLDNITGKPLFQLGARIREALEFGQRWLDLREKYPSQPDNYLHQQAKLLYIGISTLAGNTYKELDIFFSEHETICIRAGIICCRKSIQEVLNLFDRSTNLPLTEPDPRHIVHADLLAIDELYLNEEWEPEAEYDWAFVSSLLKLLAKPTIDWNQVFQSKCDIGDHDGTLKIIDYLSRRVVDQVDTDALQRRRDKVLKDAQSVMKISLANSKKEVEKAFAFGTLKEAERAKYISSVEGLELTLNDVMRFSEKHKQLDNMRSEIEQIRKNAVTQTRQIIDSLPFNMDKANYERICKVLDKGDILSANEYIEIIRAGQPLPEIAEERDEFLDFFVHKYAPLYEFLQKSESNNRLIDDVSRGRSIGPISLTQVPGPQAKEASKLLTAWFEAKTANMTIREETARDILRGLGFIPMKVVKEKTAGRLWIKADTVPVQDKRVCPVSLFGSEAEGRYRILCVWDRPSEDELLSAMGDTARGSAVIIFHFGRMSEKRRRDLAHLSRDRRRSFLLVDDMLVFYLCGERGSRLPTLFQCALPFTSSEPYTTTAGLVPIEIFYGREREKASVMDSKGSCFIYGGRQLGKTALLRTVQREFHQPERGQIGIWIDLKVRGIGYDKDPDDLWALLNTEFKKTGIIPASARPTLGPDKLLNYVEEWLQAVPNRRVLLLLDEADRFLEQDGVKKSANKQNAGEFIRVDRLKGLMDRSNRSFKVVFAGLHNVQRTTRLSNHPLAHYGEPLCIGPLIEDGEWREAMALIVRPLQSLGYRFESQDLVTLILSQTNYYPSLIQLYCRQLLKHVGYPNLPVFDRNTTPPYTIEYKHIEDAYQSQELRKAIRERFMLTLDLDTRYRVIAHVIALQSIEYAGKGINRGMHVVEIREQAAYWWPEGFRDDSSEDSFRVLVEEMEGLGVLRSVDGLYVLRSPNVISLIGTEEEILEELDSCRKKYEPPPEFELTSFRTSDKNDISRRSPLTAQQLSEIVGRGHSVSIIFGCRAAGLHDVRDFILNAQGEPYFIEPTPTTDRAQFMRILNDLKGRETEGTTVILISDECSWSEYWINDAIQKVSQLKSKSSFASVVFLANPAMIWQLLLNSEEGLGTLSKEGVKTFTLRPWNDSAIRQWLEDCSITSNKNLREGIFQTTGNWPMLLYRIREVAKDNLILIENLPQLRTLLGEQPFLSETFTAMGLDVRDPGLILREFAELGGEASEEDLIGVIEDVDPKLISKCLRWGDLLGFIHRAEKNLLRLDPIVSNTLHNYGTS